MTDDTELLDQIEAIRAKNNVNWMQIIRIALREAPDETRAVLREIRTLDRHVTHLTDQLAMARESEPTPEPMAWWRRVGVWMRRDTDT